MKKVFFFVVLLTSMAIPFRISGVSAEQALLGVSLLAALFVSYHSREVREHFKAALFSKTGQLLGLVFVLWSISSLFSYNTLKSFEIGGRTGLFILAATLIGAVLQGASERQDFMWKVFLCSAVGMGVLAVASLLGLWGILSALSFRISDLIEGMYLLNPTFHLKAYATVTVCSVPIAIYAGRYLGRGWRYVGYSYFVIAVCIVVMTQTRSAMAGLLGVWGVATAVIAIKRGYIARAAVFMVVIAVGALVWIREVRSVYITNFTDNTYLPGWLIDPHRQQIWKFAFHKFLDHPLVGNGIDQLNRLPGAHKVIPELGSSAYYVPSHPHNWIMEILSETGLLGFLPVVLVIGYLAYTLTKAFLNDRDEGALAQLLLIVGFFTCSLFSFSIWAVWWQLVLYVLFAMVSATRQNLLNRP